MASVLTWRITELEDKSALQLAYISRFYPDPDVGQACEERLARRGMWGRKRRTLEGQISFASLVLAITHGSDEDLDEGCFSVTDREIRRASRIAMSIAAVVGAALIYGLSTLQNPLLRAALGAGALLMLLAKRRRK